MNWFDYVMIGYLGVGTLSVVALIGKPRKAIEPGTAVLNVIITAALIVGLVLTR